MNILLSGEKIMNDVNIKGRKCFISAVAYVHNNTKSELEYFFSNVVRRINAGFENFELILVCDDDCYDYVKEVKQGLTECGSPDIISVIKLAYYQGAEAAICAGDDLAVGDFVYEFDSIAVNYDVNLIIDVFNKAREGNDIVFAGDDTMQLSSRLFYRLININKAKAVRHDTFRIVSRRALNRVKKMNRGIQYRKYLYVTSGLPYDYIMYKPVNSNHERKTGRESAYRLNSGISYMMIYTGIIERVTLILSAVFLLVSVGIGIWTIYSLFYDKNLASGWVSLMGVISFGFFGVFLMIMFLTKYMNIILEVNTRRLDYIVESVDKL